VIEELKLEVISQELHAIIVRATEADMEKVKKLDWVDRVEPYHFVILIPVFNTMSRRLGSYK
jgi:hypothetical protein